MSNFSGAYLIVVLTLVGTKAKRPPREFEKVVVTRAGHLQEHALVSDQMVKQWKMVAYESFRNSLIIHKDKTEEIIV